MPSEVTLRRKATRYRVRCEVTVEAKNRETAASDAHDLLIEGLSGLEFDGRNNCLAVKIAGTEEIR